MADETAMSPDGSEIAAGYEPEHAFEDIPTVTPEPVPPTQVQEPVQAAIRTLIQALVGGVVSWIVTALLGVGITLTPDVTAALGLVLLAVVSALIARIMAIPAVDAALTLIGLGASRLT